MRLGAYSCHLTKGSHAFDAYQTENIEERHRHRFEFNSDYLDQYTAAGMVATGINPNTELVEIVEIPTHPWFVGVQFHPEYKSTVANPHPLFIDFVKAALTQSKNNMDRKALTGFILNAGILMVWQYLNAPTADELAAQKAQQDSIALIEQTVQANQTTSHEVPQTATPIVSDTNLNDSILNLENQSKYGSLAPSAVQKEEITTVFTPLITAKFSNQGGRLVYVELNNYHTYDSLPLVLFNEDSAMLDFDFKFENRILNAAQLNFVPEVILPQNDNDPTVVLCVQQPTRPDVILSRNTPFRQTTTWRNTKCICWHERCIS